MSQEDKAVLVDKLGRFYHSEYVAKNQPWLLEIPFSDWLARQFIRIEGAA